MVKVASHLVRPLFATCGLLFVGLGILGTMLPGLPGTIFFILALGCFSRSSPRLESWLLSRPMIGPVLQDWKDHGSIPARVKWIAPLCMVIFAGSSLFFLSSVWAKVGVALLAAYGIWFVLSRPTSEHRSRPVVAHAPDA